jgi:hypothetical protein
MEQVCYKKGNFMLNFVFLFALLLLFDNTVMFQDRPWVGQGGNVAGIETFSRYKSDQDLRVYLFNKRRSDPQILLASIGKPPFNQQSNEYYETVMRFNNKTAECKADLKNKTLERVHFDIGRRYLSSMHDSYLDSNFTYPYSYNLIVITQEKEKLNSRGQMGGMQVLSIPIPLFYWTPSFHDRLCRAVDLYRNETYTKTVCLFQQEAWASLLKATNQELKDDFYLYVLFNFYVELEDSGLLITSAKPSLTFDRKTIMNLRSLQKRLEAQTPGITERGEEVRDQSASQSLDRVADVKANAPQTTDRIEELKVAIVDLRTPKPAPATAAANDKILGRVDTTLDMNFEYCYSPLCNVRKKNTSVLPISCRCSAAMWRLTIYYSCKPFNT